MFQPYLLGISNQDDLFFNAINNWRLTQPNVYSDYTAVELTIYFSVQVMDKDRFHLKE